MTREEVIAKARAARPDLNDEQLGAMADAYLAKKGGGTVEVKKETVKVTPKPAAKAEPKAADKAPEKPAPAKEPARVEVVRAVAPPSTAPSLPMRTPQPQSVYGGAWGSEGEAMSPDRYRRFVQEAKEASLTQGLQYLGNRAMGALTRSPPAPAVRTSDIMVDEARPRTARDFAAAPPAEMPRASIPAAARYVSGGGGRMSEYMPPPTGPDVKAMREMLRARGYTDVDDFSDADVAKAAANL